MLGEREASCIMTENSAWVNMFLLVWKSLAYYAKEEVQSGSQGLLMGARAWVHSHKAYPQTVNELSFLR